MAKQQAKTGLAGKLGNAGQSAFDAHKGDETTYSMGGDLPAGIENGIAQLVDCKFGVYEKGKTQGEYYFYAAGTVVSPEYITVDGNQVKIAGKRTQIGPEPLCATPGRTRATVDDHIAWVLNEMRKLGLDTSNMTYQQLEGAAATLVQMAPYFEFRTWKGQKQEIEHRDGGYWVGDKKYSTQAAAKSANPFVGQEPRTNHQWNGVVQNAPEVSTEGEIEDNTGTDANSGGASDSQSLAELADAADNGDDAAATRMQELAEQAGIDPSQIATWAEVAAMLEEGGGDSGEEAADTESNGHIEPQLNDVFFYKPPKKQKAVECEVIAKFDDKGVVNLKDLGDNKTIYRNVPFDGLQASIS
jgi:hypothetical protein